MVFFPKNNIILNTFPQRNSAKCWIKQYWLGRDLLLYNTFCYRRRFIKETFCRGDVLLRRRLVRRRFVEETFCKETLCMCVERISGQITSKGWRVSEWTTGGERVSEWTTGDERVSEWTTRVWRISGRTTSKGWRVSEWTTGGERVSEWTTGGERVSEWTTRVWRISGRTTSKGWRVSKWAAREGVTGHLDMNRAGKSEPWHHRVLQVGVEKHIVIKYRQRV
jgi:hypothetical protein